MSKKISAVLVGLSTLASAIGVANSSCCGQGWLENNTGFRTPEVIRQIAPNGIQHNPGRYDSDFGEFESDYHNTHNSGQHEVLGQEAHSDGNLEFDHSVQRRSFPQQDSFLLPDGSQDAPIQTQNGQQQQLLQNIVIPQPVQPTQNIQQPWNPQQQGVPQQPYSNGPQWQYQNYQPPYQTYQQYQPQPQFQGYQYQQEYYYSN